MTRMMPAFAVVSVLALGGCVRLHATEAIELGTASIPRDSTEPGLAVDEDARAWVRVRNASEPVAARGICVLLPGILGSHSSPTCENRLHADGWSMVVVAPPLVGSVLEAFRATSDAALDERGACVGRAVDRVIARAAEAARAEVESLRAATPALSDKPVLVVGESLGALMGVGLVASGRVPCDAALFVAGGGSLLDVASTSSLRRVLFGDLPIDEPEFRRGFERESRLDCLASAQRLQGCPVVCVTADIDAIVPTASQRALWSALGEPPRYRFDGGHLELFVFAESNILPAIREVASRVQGGWDAAENLGSPAEPTDGAVE
jgi:hypothetical protein